MYMKLTICYATFCHQNTLYTVVKEDQHIIIVVGSGIFFSCDKFQFKANIYIELDSRICLVGSYFSWAWGKRGGVVRKLLYDPEKIFRWRSIFLLKVKVRI